MMRDAILNFAKQFEWEPLIQNAHKHAKRRVFVVAGMGGSSLAAQVLETQDPSRKILVHRNYGLPSLSADDLNDSLVIISSYSGNTEETIDAMEKALQQGLETVVVATGGRVLKLAEEKGVPYIQLPETHIQPRSSLGFQVKALLKIMGDEEGLRQASALAAMLQPAELEDAGRELAKKLKDRIPLVYASERNFSIAYNWKIKFNETAKIPAFYNVFPELNHNELNGFDVREATKRLSQDFHLVFLKDPQDHPRIVDRMDITQRMYEDRRLPVTVLELSAEKGEFHKVFSSLVLADWTAYYTGTHYGVETEEVPMVEELKKRLH